VADVRKTVEIVFTGKNEFGESVLSVEKNLDGIGDKAEDAANNVGELGDEVDGLGGSGVANLKLLGAALAAIATSAVAKEFIDANAALENFEKAIVFATGSTEAATAELNFISEASDRLGLNLLSTADAYKRFFASVGDTLTLQETRQVFEAVAGTLSLVGGTADDVNGALVQLSQGVSKGKFELEDLKSIAERIPNFFNKFAESLEITTPELFKLISAGQVGTEELLKFANVLNGDLIGADFSGFNAATNELANAFTNLFKTIGDTGTFDLFTAGLEVAADAVNRGATNIGGFQAAWENAKQAFSGDQGVTDSIITLEKSLLALTLSALGFGTEAAAWLPPIKEADDAASDIKDTIESIPPPLAVVTRSLEDIAKSALDANKFLREIGIDPDQLEEPIEKVLVAFEKLTQIDGVDGEKIFQGLLVTLEKLTGPDFIPLIRTRLNEAFDGGSLSAEQYTQALDAVFAKNQDLQGQVGQWDATFGPLVAGLTGTAESAKKATEEVAKTAVELEKIASNERIKNIEARVTLDVAQIESDTDIAVAAIENVGTAIQSTSELLGGLFDNRLEADTWEERRQIEKGIAEQTKRQGEELRKNNQLIDAQIKKINAQTDALRRGDALITIDGEGLQPHLEAFMFEILEQIQIRVNAEGGELLLESLQ
jgi:tape measure domain-containing protein